MKLLNLAFRSEEGPSLRDFTRKEAAMSEVSNEPTTRQSRRLQFEFSPDAYQRLDRMRKVSDASSFAELVRNALRVYEWVMQKKHEGYTLALVKEGEPIKSVELIL
jgi:hypothetical protein